jgi:glycosyltransferase involved in cell wall biosynthesis
MDKKIKILFYGDVPELCTTGFSKVSSNILKRLQATGKYDITVLGINFYGEPHTLPYTIYPAGVNPQQDVYGRQRLLDLLRNNNSNFDVLFTLQDTFIMATVGEHIKKLRDGHIEEKMVDGQMKKVFTKGKGFKWIYYYPIDATPKKEWIEKSVKFADIAVPYTKYAEKESRKHVDREYNIIYHGFDKNEFYVMSEEEKEKFRDEFFKANNLRNSFLICNVNRNQERKGLLQTLIAFKLFNRIVPNSVLYTHCDVVGDRGGNLTEVATQLGIKENWLYPNPDAYTKGYSFPTSFINGIYNISDVNLSTSYGEGFGLSMVEVMGTKTLNVFPNNTAITEILENNRGILVDSGNDPNNLIANGPLDNNLIRPTTDVKDLVNKLLWVYRNSEECAKMVENAHIWAKENLDWDKIALQFDELITKSIK